MCLPEWRNLWAQLATFREDAFIMNTLVPWIGFSNLEQYGQACRSTLGIGRLIRYLDQTRAKHQD